MKYTNLLTHNLRAFSLFVGCLLDIPYLYPMVELCIMSLMYAWMHYRHERFSRMLNEKYFTT